MNKKDEILPATCDELGISIGYMDLTDFQYEIGLANNGNKIFPSLASIIGHSPCVDECGIVEVEIKLKRVVLPRMEHEEKLKLIELGKLDDEIEKRLNKVLDEEENKIMEDYDEFIETTKKRTN